MATESASSGITPHDLAARIMREHEVRRRARGGGWGWADDPDGAKLVGLAAMVSRWNVTDEQFEDKLRRLIRLPTGVARPAAERMLQLWQEAREAAQMPPAEGQIERLPASEPATQE
ncbi:MAG: hypothetical protein AB7P40_28475 [Chloroflexota bacterium]